MEAVHVHVMISSFSKDNFFLSNFYLLDIMYDGHVYPSTENAYQAAKIPADLRHIHLEQFLSCSPGKAKRLGRSIPIREDWDDVKLSVMYNVCNIKFSDPELKTLLLNTGSQELIEGNNWGDVFWGQVDGKGKNHLGRVLMNIRDQKRLEW